MDIKTYSQDRRHMINVQYEPALVPSGASKQYHTDCQQLDEADSLLLGLEKSTDKRWAPETVRSSTYNFDDSVGKAGDVFEPYPISRPSTKESGSYDLKMFLDYVMRPPTIPEPPLLPIPSDEPESRQAKKRVLKEPAFTHVPSTARAPKRSRLSHSVEDLPKIRNYQGQQWQEQYQGLLEYKAKHGHCCVPNAYPPNPVLGRWVKRQRYQYKLRQAGQQSTLVTPRLQALERIGFVWDSHSALWEERLNDLKAYRLANGDCNVPSTHSENKQLSTWVKCQRRQYRLYGQGKNSNLTKERIRALDDLGFVWDGRMVGSSRCATRVAEMRRPRSARIARD
ncbi:unnamed protein product [Cylindrotheca closterium]|uniref:Helicase-associated domain-containing protein n=1 Tax=Cylindrotheca closterium TaxID=2856 RepID=A0AAD2FGG5_9STRA|nr:unnamed protein product [Cylindrotheca closterium]